MSKIFPQIGKKQDEEVKKEAEKRVKKIQETRDKLIGVLKEQELSIQDASFALKAAQDEINKAFGEKPLTEFL